MFVPHGGAIFASSPLNNKFYYCRSTLFMFHKEETLLKKHKLKYTSVIKSMIYTKKTIKTFVSLFIFCHCKALLFQLIQDHGCQALQAPHNLYWKFSLMLGGWRRTASLIPLLVQTDSPENNINTTTQDKCYPNISYTHTCTSPKLDWNLSITFMI